MTDGLIGAERVGDTNILTRVKSEDGKLYHHQFFDDDKALAKNKKIADSGMLDKAQLGLHDNADVRMAISCPSTDQWMLFRRLHPETYKLLISSREEERIKGARQLSLLHPDWIVQSRL